MKRLLFILLLFINAKGISQSYYDEIFTKELGVSLGAMNCYTDVGGRIADPKSFKLNGGIYFSVLYNQVVGLRLEGTLGAVTATDARGSKPKIRSRNLDFTSNISEVSLLAEVHPLSILFKLDNTTALSPYVLGGIGYFAFNPKTLYNGTWVYLQPLHTEGQGFRETRRPEYKLAQVNFPLGIGLRYNLSERFILRGEAVYRMLKTDYLDDVSTKYINPALFDKYLSEFNAALAKKLADRSSAIPGGESHSPGALRGNPQKDGYYTLNVKLGIRLASGGGGYSYRKPGYKKRGCFAF